MRKNPPPTNATPPTAKGMVGVLGITARISSTTPVVRMARGWALNWPSTSVFRLPSDTDRVTIMPVAVEIIRDGIWDTRPSPMVRMQIWLMASPKVMPRPVIPITRPPTRLITVITMDMVESPLTILVAPSMAP